jgi:hypothetical protein
VRPADEDDVHPPPGGGADRRSAGSTPRGRRRRDGHRAGVPFADRPPCRADVATGSELAADDRVTNIAGARPGSCSTIRTAGQRGDPGFGIGRPASPELDPPLTDRPGRER